MLLIDSVYVKRRRFLAPHDVSQKVSGGSFSAGLFESTVKMMLTNQGKGNGLTSCSLIESVLKPPACF